MRVTHTSYIVIGMSIQNHWHKPFKESGKTFLSIATSFQLIYYRETPQLFVTALYISGQEASWTEYGQLFLDCTADGKVAVWAKGS